MRYCPRCVLPETRPNIRFDAAGNCNCATAAKKAAIDWRARADAFAALAERTKALGRPYDCVVPVSGGKDSTWQVVKVLERGLKPLCVTWRTPARNALGQANLDNLIRLGVDHVDYSINPTVERRFTLRTFERAGSPAVPMHMALFAIPLNLAVRLGIPLVVWGENSAFEYGGDAAVQGERLDRAWLKRYGVTNGTTAEDWVGDDLSLKDLAAYAWPDDAALAAAGVRAIFLGHFLRWDPVETFRVAREHGFRADHTGPKTGYYAFADIDDEFLITIHHWMKWPKFGFTRLWDNLSLEIRAGRMTRDEAIRLIAERGDETPEREIGLFCDYVGITRERFFATVERFRNPAIWQRSGEAWRIEDFLVPDWRWA